MLRVILPRLLLFVVPFAIWFVWRQVSLRTGRPMGATPWAWLFAAGAALAALSLVATALLQPDNRAETYVPAEARPDGSIAPGRFEAR